MIRYRLLLFLILLTHPFLADCQNYPLQHFTTDNGLPSNDIYFVYRDSKGFLWIATDKGIARYNGIEFEKFTTDDGLADNEVFFFQEDYEGRLWIGTYNGELCFYKDGVFHSSANTPFLKKSIRYSYIMRMALEKDSSITILFSDHLAFLNVLHDKCNAYPLKSDNWPSQKTLISINKINEDRYRILTEDQSFEIDTESNYVANTLQPNRDTFEMTRSQNIKYLFSGKGVYSADQELLVKFGDGLAKSHIYSILRNNHDWFAGTGNGLFINNGLQILKGNEVNSLTQDVEGNLWISTLYNGLFCLAKDFSQVVKYDTAYIGNIKYAKAIGSDLFFTTGNSNLYRFANEKSVLLFDYFKHFKEFFNSDVLKEHYRVTNTNGLGIDNNYKYYNIEFNFSYIIDKINTNAPVFSSLTWKRLKLNIPFKEMIVGKEKLYIRSAEQIFEIDKSSIKPGCELKSQNIGTNIMGRRIFGMAQAPDNSLWYSSFERVNKIVDTTTIPQTQFGNITFKWMQIAGNFAVGITHKNQLLVCHNFDNNNISIDTLPGQNFVWDKLYKLNDTTFIASTNSLYRLLSLKNNHVPCYTIEVIENNALPLNAEYICGNDSFCYFFNKGSITRVAVNYLIVKHQTPEIFFKSLKTRYKSYPIKSGMAVSYNESKNISISFSPFSFGSRYVICEYSISKDTSEYWRQVKNNEINLFDPPFGNYKVKVKARTLSGEFSKPFEFNFTIAKPFWATSWFIIAAVLLFVGLIVLTLRLITLRNTGKRERTHQNEIKFLKSEYKALNALMNPHFIFNTLNNVQWLVNNDDKLTANHYLRVFSDLVRQNMNNVSKELISLSNEIELVNNYLKLEKLRFKEAFNYEINIDDEVDMDNVKIPPLLIQPLVENAIKHGLLPGTTTANNQLKMNIYRKTDKLYIDVIDNGVGFNESQKKARHLHKSTGLENIRKRIEKLSLMHDINISFTIAELKTESGAPSGTLAQICISLNDE